MSHQKKEIPSEIWYDRAAKKKIPTDNVIEFTYKYISEDIENPFDIVLHAAGIEALIPPGTP